MGDEKRDDSLSLVGTIIEEKYAVESVVGAGGFATVYRATHLLWKRPVAVKVFTALGQVSDAHRGKLLQDFIQEGALLAELSERSTAICQARDVGTLTTPSGETAPFMVLEWLEGRPLDAVLAAEADAGAPPRSIDETFALLEPIAQALSLAHEKGIAHRDVKPANIFVLDGEGRAGGGVKLLDFGIAKVVQDAQKMGFGKTAGHVTSFTPYYGAPEQFNRTYGATGPWTDVFALALVFAEVSSGAAPMAGDDLVQLAYAAADPERRPTPRALGVATSDEVEAVFLRALAVKPDDRFATAGAFWNALRARVTGDAPRSSERLFEPRASATADTIATPAADAGEVATDRFAKTERLEATALDPAVASDPLPGGASSASPSPPGRRGSRIALIALAGAAAAGAVALLLGGAPTSPGGAASPDPPASSAPAAAASSAAAPTATPACPEGMILIPGGDFFMGSDERDALPTEKPPHKVNLRPYCLDRFEVTVAKYKYCSDHGMCRRAGKENVWPGITAAQREIYDPLCNFADPEGKADHPINCIDWQQAREVCASRDARLPTEAEWEFAARGPDGRIYPWGDDAPSAKLLNACGTECLAWEQAHPDPKAPARAMYDADDGFATTAPVGSFPKGKSRYGVEDVVGNVWEWVSDYYAEYDPASAKRESVDPKGPDAGTDRVIRGGAWNGAEASWVRPSFRFHADEKTRSYGVGVRCATSPRP